MFFKLFLVKGQIIPPERDRLFIKRGVILSLADLDTVQVGSDSVDPDSSWRSEICCVIGPRDVKCKSRSNVQPSYLIFTWQNRSTRRKQWCVKTADQGWPGCVTWLGGFGPTNTASQRKCIAHRRTNGSRFFSFFFLLFVAGLRKLGLVSNTWMHDSSSSPAFFRSFCCRIGNFLLSTPDLSTCTTYSCVKSLGSSYSMGYYYDLVLFYVTDISCFNQPDNNFMSLTTFKA